jgi:hypothetical protein
MTPISLRISPREGLLMNQVFGRDSQRVLTLITRIADPSPADVDRVTSAWKQASIPYRARAWARLARATPTLRARPGRTEGRATGYSEDEPPAQTVLREGA